MKKSFTAFIIVSFLMMYTAHLVGGASTNLVANLSQKETQRITKLLNE